MDNTLPSKLQLQVAAKQAFLTFDRDKTGFLDAVEVGKLVRNWIPQLTMAEVRLVISNLHSLTPAADGRLSFTDLLIALQALPIRIAKRSTVAAPAGGPAALGGLTLGIQPSKSPLEARSNAGDKFSGPLVPGLSNQTLVQTCSKLAWDFAVYFNIIQERGCMVGRLIQ